MFYMISILISIQPAEVNMTTTTMMMIFAPWWIVCQQLDINDVELLGDSFSSFLLLFVVCIIFLSYRSCIVHYWSMFHLSVELIDALLRTTLCIGYRSSFFTDTVEVNNKFLLTLFQVEHVNYEILFGRVFFSRLISCYYCFLSFIADVQSIFCSITTVLIWSSNNLCRHVTKINTIRNQDLMFISNKNRYSIKVDCQWNNTHVIYLIRIDN
jgi:hypothetical protein